MLDDKQQRDQAPRGENNQNERIEELECKHADAEQQILILRNHQKILEGRNTQLKKKVALLKRTLHEVTADEYPSCGEVPESRTRRRSKYVLTRDSSYFDRNADKVDLDSLPSMTLE